MMQIRLLLVAFAAFAVPSLGFFKYDDLVLTTVKVTEEATCEGGVTRVSFDSNAKGCNEPVFLKNITEVVEKRTWSTWFRATKYTADKLSIDYVLKARADNKNKKEPLLAIHGFNVKPCTHLEQCSKAKGHLKNYHLIPVVWPSAGGVHNYFGDRGTSKESAEALKNCLEEYGDKFPDKSLIAHSMGNRVLQYAANEAFNFDNIFMVAADVDDDIFKTEAGVCIGKMLRKFMDEKSARILGKKQNGTIHVVYNTEDHALKWSRRLGKNRLGLQKVNVTQIHASLQGMIKSKERWVHDDAEDEKIDQHNHSYQWEFNGMKFYEETYDPAIAFHHRMQNIMRELLLRNTSEKQN